MKRDRYNLFIGTWVDTQSNPFMQSQVLRVRERTGLLVDGSGRIVAIETPNHLRNKADEVIDLGDAWLLPGFVDAHIHFPQVFATAYHAGPLLEWLEKNVFPRETKLADPAFAEQAAGMFVHQMVRQGTTCAAIYGSQFVPANRALSQALDQFGMRAFWGPTLMDRGAPEVLCHSVSVWQDQLNDLASFLAGHPKQLPSLIPRFVLSCSPELTELISEWAKSHPDWLIQTHINENVGEIEAVRAEFPKQTYAEVYQNQGLLGPRTLLAHSIHATDREWAVLRETQSRVVHCPCSNGFLGSGLFPLHKALAAQVNVCVGTDIGAGTSFSMARELTDLYKIQALQQFLLKGEQLLFLATQAGADALGLGSERGSFDVGKQADFSVWDPQADPYLSARWSACESEKEALFLLLVWANPNTTYIDGKKVAEFGKDVS